MRLTSDSVHAGPCFHCGQAASAIWSGVEAEVRICRGCAIDVLPALIADAVVEPRSCRVDDVSHLFLQATARFWEAVAHLVVRHHAAKPYPIVADDFSDLIQQPAEEPTDAA